MSVLRILEKHKFNPSKIKLVHALNEDHPDIRLQFCEEMSQRLIEDPQLLFKVCFSDDCTFYLNVAVIRHNCRYWDANNPHLFREIHNKYLVLEYELFRGNVNVRCT